MNNNTLREWDAIGWAEKFAEYSKQASQGSDYARSMLRDLRKQEYNQVIQDVRGGCYLLDGKTLYFSPSDIEYMQKKSRFYNREFSVMKMRPDGDFQTEIIVENEDCLVAAKRLKDKGYNVAVLNMASRRNPGGGVYEGAGAQEENLFRRSNLFMSMYAYTAYASQYGLSSNPEYKYPLDRNFGGVYTPGALVYRGLEKDGYPLLGMDCFKMSFIAVPGMNRPDLTPTGRLAPGMVYGIKNKMRTIFRIGISRGHDALVLGALGCGAFRNPPRDIARLFHEVIEEIEFKNKIRLIDFAIVEDHNSRHAHNPDGNLKPFQEEFEF